MESSTSSSLEALVGNAFPSVVPKVEGIGVVVGALRHEDHVLRAFAQGGAGPHLEAIYEIGSVTKTFTALLLAEMVTKGQVRLDDPVSQFLPEASGLRNRNDSEPTLGELATHTAGLPKSPRNLWRKALRNRRNPYSAYTYEDLEHALSATRLKTHTRSRYSNFGFAVLGHALGRAAGMTYEELLVERVCKPLQMTDTMIQLRPGLLERRAQGRSKRGGPVPEWQSPVFAGAGGIRSTAADMMQFVRSHLRPTETPLSQALEMVQTPRFVIRKDRLSIGLAWMILSKRGHTTISHAGATGGFSAFAGFDPQAEVGIVVLANSSMPSRVTRGGMSLLERLQT
jgi:D-alanyl-D-alanine-carboxypeptidase/D-alanyl-D-alanine-endopeptidase